MCSYAINVWYCYSHCIPIRADGHGRLHATCTTAHQGNCQSCLASECLKYIEPFNTRSLSFWYGTPRLPPRCCVSPTLLHCTASVEHDELADDAPDSSPSDTSSPEHPKKRKRSPSNGMRDAVGNNLVQQHANWQCCTGVDSRKKPKQQ
jgi:hypothetical protein